MEFYASCPEGFEIALSNELRAMGLCQVRRLKGRVTFAGTQEDAYRACLWSRLASRVFVVLARFDCYTASDLYDGAYDIAWENILAPGATIAIAARGTTDELRNSHFSALRVKDAVCDRLAEVAGRRPSIDVDYPDARIALTLREGRASLQLDLSGDPLFKRLPREATRPGAAHILRPDYAALMLEQAGWGGAIAAADTTGEALALVDFSCAGGGVELEAVQMLINRAPGLLREHWGFEGWAQHDADAWNQLISEANARTEAAANRSATIIAADADNSAAEFARRIIRKSGFARYVRIVPAGTPAILDALERDGIVPGVPAQTTLVADTTETSIKNTSMLLALAVDLRSSEVFASAHLAALTRDDMLPRALGTAPADALNVKPNNEDAALLTFAPAGEASHAVGSETAGAEASANAAPTPSAATVIDLGDGSPCPVLVPESDQFARRLRKVAKLRHKWAQREGVTCYRVYDADLPDYSAAIDLYEGSAATPGRWLVIAEYAAPATVDAALAQARMLDILTIAPRILNVDADHVFAKARTRSRGGSQYAKNTQAQAGAHGGKAQNNKAHGSKTHGGTRAGGQGTGAPAPDIRTRPLPLIKEGGLTFAVNFDDYLDTGIFLDHRITRGLVRERARGKRYFLNLFAYTGTATCYAADAGVEETVTVDLSNTYLDWAERNMELNGFTGREHHFVRADVMRWIADMRQTRNRWDLIFCDPPTFSNSSKMGQRTWDVQRDHVELLIGLSRLLTRDGEAIFSCNLRTFRPDTRELARAGVVLTDITAETIPEDFARNQRIHRCYILRRYTPEEAMRRVGMDEDEIRNRQRELREHAAEHPDRMQGGAPKRSSGRRGTQRGHGPRR